MDQTLSLTLNGKELNVEPQHGGLSLLEWMRGQAHVKSAKHACGEGGCGACAVIVSDVDPATGQTLALRSVNSCLTPVFAVNGCDVLTAEGLPKNQDGVHPVAERLAGFHASQCGFCTPGMAVACHAALAKAAACGQPGASTVELRDALDGNLCRCTGYRPIIAACKSFAVDVDMEDLGTNTFTSAGKPLPVPVDLTSTGTATQTAPSQAPRSTAEYALAAGQKVIVPGCLADFIQVIAQHGNASLRLVAGNTGPGVYKDWPTEDILVHIMHVAELRSIDASGPGEGTVRLGAAVTLERVIDQLRAWAQGSGPNAVAGAGVWGEVASHLQRVAGHHVRGAATLVGNLVLARRKGLPSDVATLMLAARATLQVIDGPALPVVVDLDDFLHKRDGGFAPGALDSALLLVTATLIPSPSAECRFWSNRIASRWANAASVVNAAALRPGPGCGTTPTFVLGMDLSSSPGEHVWRVFHCSHVEAFLADTAAPPTTLAALALPALKALAQDLAASFGLPAASTSPSHVEFLRSTAEGLLLQALAALYFPDAQTHNEPGLNGHGVTNGINGLSLNGHDGPSAAPAALPLKMSAPAAAAGCQVLPDPDPASAPLTQALPKESAVLQARGVAHYSDDVAVQSGALYAALVLSPVAKGTVRRVDTTAALKVPGAVRFIGHTDIPGKNSNPDDEPVFGPEVLYHGQPVGLMLGQSYQAAQRAALLVVVEMDAPETPAVITAEEALAQGAVWELNKMMPFLKPGVNKGSISLGAEDVQDKVVAAPLRLMQQKVHLPSQAHMYMEPQTAVAELDEDGCVRIHLSTQTVDSALAQVASLLNLPHNKVEIVCRRTGGGFGGKMSNPGRFAAAAAVAAMATGKQVRLATNRNVDLAIIGGRCQVDATFDVGYDEQGHILAVNVSNVLTGGAYKNLSTMDPMGMMSVVDNVYHVPSFRAEYTLLHCNLPARTAVRAPGDFPSVIVMESVIESVAAALGMDPLLVRERNMRQPAPDGGMMTSSVGKPLGVSDMYSMPRIWQELKAKVDWSARSEGVKAFNTQHQWRKRGISITPCRYPLVFFKRSAMVHIYVDGSVRVAHPGIEIGQGLGIKVLQTAAYELSQALPESQRPLPLDLLRIADPSTYTLPHNSATVASTTSDAACAAVRQACAELVSRLKPFAEKLGDDYTWQQLIAKTITWPGFRGLVDLTAVAEASLADELSTPAPGPFHHLTTYGAAVAEVEVDVLTGDRQVLSVDILFDCGRSLNPGVDLGQIEGAFVFGMGMLLSEHMEADPTTGACTTNSTWSYKVPGPTCVPHKFNVDMLKDSPLGGKGLLSAKGTGEPPLLLSTCVLFALEAAVRAAAQQVYGEQCDTVRLQVPATPQAVKQACGTAPLAAVLERLAAQ